MTNFIINHRRVILLINLVLSAVATIYLYTTDRDVYLKIVLLYTIPYSLFSVLLSFLNWRAFISDFQDYAPLSYKLIYSLMTLLVLVVGEWSIISMLGIAGLPAFVIIYKARTKIALERDSGMMP